jgi:peptide deformylase
MAALLLVPGVFIGRIHGLSPSRFAVENNNSAWSNSRRFFLQCSVSGLSSVVLTSNPSRAQDNMLLNVPLKHPFKYSPTWTGTALPLVSLADAAQSASSQRWPMGRWPDPILRRSADPVDDILGSDTLKQACECLRNTAIAEKAVGLAAQQCGVNARIIYLKLGERSNSYLTMINPRITDRSPETEMRVWRENCLVLPPTFQATVLRDAWVDVAYQDWKGSAWFTVRLRGEAARAAQHEMDHDRGILVTDHVSLDELENDLMRSIEGPGHELRMALAYTRYNSSY